MGKGVADIFGTRYISTFLTGAVAGGFVGGVLGFLLGRKLGEAEKEKIIWATGHLPAKDGEQLNQTLRPLLESLVNNLNGFELEGLPGKMGALLERDLHQYGLLQINATNADIMGYKRLASPALVSLMPSKFALSETGMFELFHSYFEQREDIDSHNRATALAFVTCLYNICRTLTLFMLLLSEYPGKQAAAALDHCHNTLLAFLKNVENSNLTQNSQWSFGSFFGKQRKTLVGVLPIACTQFRDTLLMLQQEKGIVECGKLIQEHYRVLFTSTLEVLLRLTDSKACQATVSISLEKLGAGILYYNTAEKTGRVALDENEGFNKAIRYVASYWLKHSPAKIPIHKICYQTLFEAMQKSCKAPEQQAYLERLAQITYILLLACKFEQFAAKRQFTCQGYQRNQNGDLIRFRMLSRVILQAVQSQIKNLFTLPELHDHLLACQQPKRLQEMGACSLDGAQFLTRAETQESPIQRVFACQTTVTNAPLFKPMQILVDALAQLDSLQKISLELLADEQTPLPEMSHIRGDEALYGYAIALAYAPDKANVLFPDMHNSLDKLFTQITALVTRINFQIKKSFLTNDTPTLKLDGTSSTVPPACSDVFEAHFLNKTNAPLIVDANGQCQFQKPTLVDYQMLSHTERLLNDLGRGIRKAEHPNSQSILSEVDKLCRNLEDFQKKMRNARTTTVSAIAEELAQSHDENTRLTTQTRALFLQIQELTAQTESSEIKLGEALRNAKNAVEEAREAQNALATMCTNLLDEFEAQLVLIENLKNELQQACLGLKEAAQSDSAALRSGIEQLERKIDEELGRLAERTKGMAASFKTQSQEVQSKFETLRGRLEEQTNELSKLKLQLKDALQKLQILEAESRRLQTQPKHSFLRVSGLQDICTKLEKSAKKLSFFRSSRPIKEDNLLTFIELLLDNKDGLYDAYRKTPHVWQNQKANLLQAYMVNYSRGLRNTSTSRAVFEQILAAFEQNRLEEALSNNEIHYHGHAIMLHNQHGNRSVQYQTKRQALAF